MKILFYIDSMQKGGANRVIANLADYFVQEHDVLLVNDIVPDSNKDEYEISGNIRRFFLDQNHEVYGNPFQKQSYRIRQIRNILLSEKPDIAISFLGPPNYRLLLASIGTGVQTLVSVRNDPYREYGKGIRKIIARIIFRLADKCVFQTEDAKAYFSEYTQNHSRVIFNPVNKNFFDYALGVEKPEILMVGRLEPQKNVKLAIKAFSEISPEYDDFHLVICGDGSLRDELIQYACELKVRNKIDFLGVVEDVPERLSTASVYVLSSDYEGMPNALMEAMAMGVPVISTDCPCGGPRILIDDSSQGILVPCNDVKTLASAMKEVIGNDELRKSLRTSVKAKAEQFRLERILEEWSNYIKE